MSLNAVSLNDLVLIGTGFVMARVLYVWYMVPRKARATSPTQRR